MNKLLCGITALLAFASMAHAQGGVAAAAASRPTAKAASDTELGRRYVDALRGYSLCPPTDTDRRRDTIGSVTTTWTRRDANSNAILWSITVQTARPESNSIDLQAFSQALGKRIAANDFEITANELNELAYKVNLKCNFINNVKLREKRWKEAASFFESMVALNPFHIIGWHCLATSYEGLNQSNKIAAIEEKINSLVATDERSHSLATKFGYLIGMGDGNHPYAYPKRR